MVRWQQPVSFRWLTHCVLGRPGSVAMAVALTAVTLGARVAGLCLCLLVGVLRSPQRAHPHSSISIALYYSKLFLQVLLPLATDDDVCGGGEDGKEDDGHRSCRQ